MRAVCSCLSPTDMHKLGLEQEPPADGAELRPSRSSYQGARLPWNERDRLSHLRSFDLLDTKAEGCFDDITQLLCSIFHAPIALVSLVDKERQWFKSVQGLEARETDRRSSFCAWTLLPVNPEVLVVEDALEDGRFKNNPLVEGPPYIRFYAGAPLVASNGLRLGSLCIIDKVPRQLSAESCALLCNFAEMVVREIERDKVPAPVQPEVTVLPSGNSVSGGSIRGTNASKEGVFCCDTSDPKWRILFMNDAAALMAGIGRKQAMGMGVWELFQTPGREQAESAAAWTLTAQKGVDFSLTAVSTKAASPEQVALVFRPATSDNFDQHMPQIGIPGFVQSARAENTQIYFAFIKKRPKQVHAMEERPFGADRVMLPRRSPFSDVKLGPFIGKGSFSRVFRATYQEAVCAVKVIEMTGKEIMDEVGQLLEATAGMDLAHPNVMQTYKYGTQEAMVAQEHDDESFMTDEEAAQSRAGGGTPLGPKPLETWLVLEFCNKGSLQDCIDRGFFVKTLREVSSEQQPGLWAVLTTAWEVAGAMSYLHSLDLVHGDLIGNNILLCSSTKDARGFTVKIADFGLSRTLIKSQQTQTYGTVTHMPPELLAEGLMSKAVDVYAYGVLLWELFVGDRPWAGLRQMQIIQNVSVDKVALEWPAGTPAQYKALAERCMSKDRQLRPTFDDIQDELDELQSV